MKNIFPKNVQSQMTQAMSSHSHLSCHVKKNISFHCTRCVRYFLAARDKHAKIKCDIGFESTKINIFLAKQVEEEV